jgi:hypothetical protein
MMKTAAYFASVSILAVSARWTESHAQEWFAAQPYRKGANFVPSTASNQFEMFQAAHFDEETLSRELGFAGDLGFNIVRVFLHDLLWETEGDSFLDRVDQFLGMADGNGIGSMLVLFDGCWDPMPQTGAQLEPRPHVHNSRWVQSPGKAVLQNISQHEDRLKAYVQAVLTRFKDDHRVVLWDIFNEPDNGNTAAYGFDLDRVPSAEDAKGTELHPMEKAVGARNLLSLAFGWAREVGPSQPLTAAVYSADTGDADADAYRAETHQWMLNESDVISFHNYASPSGMADQVRQMQALGRPLVCSEYMARPVKCTFDPILGNLKDENVWAVNWGFVSGRAQTIYPWDSWQVEYTSEPPLWFHDVLRPDGTPYIEAEAEYIRTLKGTSAAEAHLV